MTDMAVELVPYATDEVYQLLAELDEYYIAEYPVNQRLGIKIDAVFKPHIRFFLARVGGAAVGCGGVALFPDFAELKRMYVRPSVRRRGVASEILQRIEAITRATGRNVLRLQTGDRQSSAIRFYERFGFRKCQAFGHFVEMTPDAIEASIFFEKQL